MAPDVDEVSVVIPAHNASTTLDAALASVATQTVKPREVVVVDDASSDGTARVAERWAAMLPLRVVSSATNLGAGASRHTGVEASTAPMLAFQDADDVWFPDHLERCLAIQRSFGGVVAGRGIYWHPGEGVWFPVTAPGAPGADPTHLASLVREHHFGAHVVLRRSDYEHVGGFDPVMEGVEDWDLWIRLALEGVPLWRTSTATGLYRQHASSTSRRTEYVAQAGLRMLDRLEYELLVGAGREVLADALRESRARLRLKIAYARLEVGDCAGARRSALRSLVGPRDVALRGAAVAMLPRVTSQLRHRRFEARDFHYGGSANSPRGQ